MDCTTTTGFVMIVPNWAAVVFAILFGIHVLLSLIATIAGPWRPPAPSRNEARQ